MRILFIGYDYHHYTKSIASAFSELGYECFFHSIQPENITHKVARRLNTATYRKILDSYHLKIIKQYPHDFFNKIVFLQTHQISPENITLLKSRQKIADYILYNWDSLNTHDYSHYIKYFDSVFTFDPDDAKKLCINYLPLFATPIYQNISHSPTDPLSVYFLGNIVNPERYKILREFESFSISHGLNFKYYLSSTFHGFTKMINSGIIPRNVSLRQIDQKSLVDMITHSSAVFDFANHLQSGFTMRVIENLCAGKKIITNNKNILSSEFYSEDRIHLFSGGDFSGVPEFLSSPLKYPQEKFEQYYVNNFAKQLLVN